MPKIRLRDIVILLPGITGSVLQKDGKDLWALSGQAVWQGLTSFGASLQALLLKDDDPELDNLGDGIQATRLIPDPHLVAGLHKFDGYSETARLITDHFEVKQGSIWNEQPANFYEFPYDWRRNNRCAARQLKRFLDRRLEQWRQSSGAKDAKVIFLAHSMGGLVARYYLEVLEGWPNCRALITFGTPYRGSLNALNFLTNDYKHLFVDLTKVMRSFTSIYQLLPIYEAVKTGDAYRRVAEIEGIPGIDRERAKQALAFHREIEAAVEEHQKDENYHNRGYKILPIVGTRQPTAQSATLMNGDLTVGRVLPAGVDAFLGDGDGTVPRLSAIPIELSEEYRETFVPERHSSLQRNPTVLNDVRSRIEQMQVVGLGAIRGPEVSSDAENRPAISLDLEDLYVPGEPIELRGQLINVSTPMGQLEAQIAGVGRQADVALKRAFRAEGDTWVLTLEGLTPGLYRLSVRTSFAGPGAPPPVHDLFEVAG